MTYILFCHCPHYYMRQGLPMLELVGHLESHSSPVCDPKACVCHCARLYAWAGMPTRVLVLAHVLLPTEQLSSQLGKTLQLGVYR